MISDVKAAIQTAIQTNITAPDGNTIACYTSVPGSPTAPCFFVVPKTGTYLTNMPNNKVQIEFEVMLLLSKGNALENVQDQLDAYLLPTGTNSVKAALVSVPTTYMDWLRVTGFEYSGFTFSGTEYLGAKWHVIVMI